MPEAAIAVAPAQKKPEPIKVYNPDEPKKLPASTGHFSVGESSFAYAVIDATLPVGHTVDDAMRPEYWAHHAHKMRKPQFSSGPDWSGAIINVRCEDHSVYARLYVRAVREKSLIVALIGKPEYFGPKTVESKIFDIKWNVGRRGFDVIRKSDGEVVASATNVKTKEEAEVWIRETTGTA